MHLGSGVEELANIGGGWEGNNRQEFQPLWVPPGDGDLLQIPGEGDPYDVRRLASSGKEFGLDEEGLE